MRRPKAVAFDMFETVVSLEPMRPQIEALGLPGSALELLYASGLRDAFALAAAGAYQPFKTVLDAALREILARHGLDASADTALIFETMLELPPVPDAFEAFHLLKEAGIRVFTLSNGAEPVTRAQLEKGGLLPYVERIVSVDEVKLSKPRREVYVHSARAAGVAEGEMCLVATHPWDIQGAKAAGLPGAYVARGKPYPAYLAAPDVTGRELRDVARALAAG